MAADSQNDVWATLTGLGGQLISARRDVELARANVQTRASPSGTSDSTIANPFPGTQGNFPQAEVKPQPGAASVAMNLGWAWIAAAVILVLVLLKGVR